MSRPPISAVYLDVCTLCRPFDDQAQTRIRRETESYFRIIRAIERGCYTLVCSPVHLMEIAAIADPLERNEVKAILVEHGTPCATGDLKRLRERAEALAARGMGAADSAHVAFAEASAAFFISAGRFLAMPAPQRMESVRRHRAWQQGLDQARFFDQVFGDPPRGP